MSNQPKQLKTRIQLKHDFEENWITAGNSGFIPKSGELIIYDAEIDDEGNALKIDGKRSKTKQIEKRPRIKVGDGGTNVNNLKFSPLGNLEDGSSTNSIQQVGNIAGTKGYYFDYIYYETGKDENNNDVMSGGQISLTTTRTRPEMSTLVLPEPVSTFTGPNYKAGDRLCLVNGSKYEYGGLSTAKVSKVQNNVITFTGNLGFTTISQSDSKDWNIDDFTLFTIDHPEIGEVVVREGTFATGTGSKALGLYATASGQNTVAVGNFSSATGRETTAYYCAHAEGRETKAIGEYSHAEGRETKATAQGAHAEGNGTTASGHRSHAEGLSTTASGQQAHAEGQGTLAKGASSHAGGVETEASGIASIACGYRTHAIGDYATALGTNSIASETNAFAVGASLNSRNLFNAFLLKSHETKNMKIDKDGIITIYGGNYRTMSFKELCPRLKKDKSYRVTTVIKDIDLDGKETASEKGTIKVLYADGDGQLIELSDFLNNITEEKLTARLYLTTGYESTGTKDSPLCTTFSIMIYEGEEESLDYQPYYWSTAAWSANAVAMGHAAQANAETSFSLGLGTIANKSRQFVFGQYNIPEPIGDKGVKYAHIVGWGWSDSNRRNIHTLDTDGNAWYLKDVYVGGSSQTNAKKLATEEYVNSMVGTTSGSTVLVGAIAPQGTHKLGTLWIDTSANGGLKYYDLNQKGESKWVTVPVRFS